jgi:uncharacterized damage-inducible protein DinB
MKTMDDRINYVTAELQKNADNAKATFSSLSADQLNWKPAEKSWSVAQCLDHLIKTHSLYFPLFEQLETGKIKQSFWERNSPLSGFFGRFLIKSLNPENQKKIKAPSKAQPSVSEVGADIVERYSEHQHQIIEYLQKLPADIDPAKSIITSPLLGIVTYSLDDCFTILVVHCQRHLGQARRVTETAGFPGKFLGQGN